MLHEFSRTELLIGKNNIEKLKNSKVAIFGIGGVGTFVAEGLARSGVGKFVLIDDDCICLTNINRQIHATQNTVGKVKVEVMKERILSINPKAEVETFQDFYLPGSAEKLVRSDYDYIVDAIDTVTGKIDLIISAKAKNIPVISSMGTGNKMDPTGFMVADIYSTSVCPLAKVMRKELRARGVESLKVVYSREEPIKPVKTGESKEFEEAEEFVDNKSDIGSNTSTRRGAVKKQVPGSIAFMPSVAGLILASEVIKDLMQK